VVSRRSLALAPQPPLPHGVTSTLALTAADGRRWSDELRRPPWKVVEDHDEGSGRWYMGWGDPDDRS